MYNLREISQTEVNSVTLYIGSLYWFRNWSWSVGASPSYDSLSLPGAISNHWKSRGSKTVRIEEISVFLLKASVVLLEVSYLLWLSFLITEVKSIHSPTYSWLQAAQDFHEEQDRKNNETLRESYRIRLGGKQYFEMLILECFFTYLSFTPLISRK